LGHNVVIAATSAVTEQYHCCRCTGSS